MEQKKCIYKNHVHKKRIGIVISDILHLPQNADYKNVNLMIISSFHKKKLRGSRERKKVQKLI